MEQRGENGIGRNGRARHLLGSENEIMDIVNTVKKTGSLLKKLQERLEEKESSVDRRHSGGSSKVCRGCVER